MADSRDAFGLIGGCSGAAAPPGKIRPNDARRLFQVKLPQLSRGALVLGKSDDITFRRIVWTEHSRGVIRGGISNIEFDSCAVKKSTLAPAHGLGLCMATAGGGPQLGQPHDPAITGVVVRNHTSEGTGDDAVALFNVHDGEVSDCHISDSFARGILLYKSTARLSGNVLHRNPVWHDDHNMSTWD